MLPPTAVPNARTAGLKHSKAEQSAARAVPVDSDVYSKVQVVKMDTGKMPLQIIMIWFARSRHPYIDLKLRVNALRTSTMFDFL